MESENGNNHINNTNNNKETIYSQERQTKSLQSIIKLVAIAFIAFAVIMVIFAGITISNLITSQINQERISNVEKNQLKLYDIFIGTLEKYAPDREKQNQSREIIFENNDLLGDINRTLSQHIQTK